MQKARNSWIKHWLKNSEQNSEIERRYTWNILNQAKHSPVFSSFKASTTSTVQTIRHHSNYDKYPHSKDLNYVDNVKTTDADQRSAPPSWMTESRKALGTRHTNVSDVTKWRFIASSRFFPFVRVFPTAFQYIWLPWKHYTFSREDEKQNKTKTNKQTNKILLQPIGKGVVLWLLIMTSYRFITLLVHVETRAGYSGNYWEDLSARQQLWTPYFSYNIYKIWLLL